MSKPSLLLLHGFGQNSSLWESVTAELGPRVVCAPDLRGHGTASSRRPINTALLVSDVLELARQMDRPILVGYSMGGRVAMRAALADQSLFSGLVLISTSAGIESTDERLSRVNHDERLAIALEESGHKAFEAIWQNAQLWEGDSQAVMRKAALMRSQTPAADLAASLRGFGSGKVEPVWSDLHLLRLPTLMLCGQRDQAYREQANRMLELVSSSSVETIPGAGHSLPVESPAELAESIERFSRRLRPEES